MVCICLNFKIVIVNIFHSFFKGNSKTELKIVRKNLENVEGELDKTEDECSKLKISVDSEHQTSDSLRQMITELEKELSQEKSNSLNVQKTLTR